MARKLLGSTGAGGGGGGGGGGGAAGLQLCDPTPISTVEQTRHGSTYVYSYYHVLCGEADSIRHLGAWGLSRFYYQNGTSNTGQYIQALTINKSTGVLTLGSEATAWSNSSGSALSTTYCTYDPYTGGFMCGGHNAWPGYSSHVFGYSVGRIDSNGNAQNCSGQYSNKDHGYNGTYFSDYNSGGYFMTAGYDAGSSSHCHYRGWQGSRSGAPSLQFDSVTSNFTSSSGGQQVYGQWDYTPTGLDKVAGVGLSLNNNNGNGNEYGRGMYAANGSYGTWSGTANGYPSSNGMSSGSHFRYSDGALVNAYPNNYNLVWPDYSAPVDNPKSGTEGYQQTPQINASNYYHQHIGLGSDHWLSLNMVSSTSGNMYGRPLLWKINSNYDPETVQIFDHATAPPAAFASPSPFQQNVSWHCVWENPTDTYPKWLVSMDWNNDKWVCNSFQITADLASLIS